MKAMLNRSWTVLLPAMLVLAGCPGSGGSGQTTPQAPPAASGGIVRLPLEIAPDDAAIQQLDLSDPRLQALARAVELPLLRSRPDGTTEPGLATAWNSQDGIEWTLRLQVFGSDNVLPGKALIRGWERLLRGEEAELKAQLADLIDGALEFSQGLGEDISGLQLEGDTLTVTLTRRNWVFPLWVSQPGLGLTDAALANAENPAPTGPFVLPEQPFQLPGGNVIELKRNDGFTYGRAKADELHFVLEPDREIQLELFRNDQLHAANLSIDAAREVDEDPALAPQLVKHETASPLVAIFDHGQHPWGDQAFQSKQGLRRAMNWGIDRADIAEQAASQLSPWSHYFPSALREFIQPGQLNSPLYPLTPEIEKARVAQREADHEQGNLLPQGMVLAYDNTPFNRAVMLEAADYWHEISVRLRPFPTDRAEMRNLLALGTHEVTLRSLRPGYPDPDALVYPHMYSGISALGGNWSRLSMPDVDELILETQSSSDPALRRNAFQELSKLIEERAVFVPIGYHTPLLLISSNLGGYTLRAYDFDASLPAQDFAELGLRAAEGAANSTDAE